jgi:hypothetical protein
MMLKAKMLLIDFISWNWKVEKKNFSFEKKSFFRDANSINSVACSDRNKWENKRDVLSDLINECQRNRSMMSM